MTSQSVPAIRPHVEIVNGQPLTNSFKIAEHFGKRHDTVLRAIAQLDCSPKFRARNFAETSAHVPMPNGGHRQIPAYTITRDGFTFLAMGFTGKEAAQWKEAYIEAFNRMEASLQTPSAPQAIPLLLTGDGQAQAGKRYLVTFGGDGQTYAAWPLEPDCCVMTPDQFVKNLHEFPLDADTLTALIISCVRRLERRASA